MAYPTQRSNNAALREGATDGKYQKPRPDTELSSDNVAGNHTIMANKSTLPEKDGYAPLPLPSPATRVTPNAF